MAKFFRRIAAFVLVLVMVCLVSVPAFADDFFSASADYDDNQYGVGAYANIKRYSTNGSISFYSMDSNVTTTDLYATVTYRYYPYAGAPASPPVTQTLQQDTAHLGVGKSFAEGAIFCMIDATYTFRAEVHTSFGTQLFRTDPVTLVY